MTKNSIDLELEKSENELRKKFEHKRKRLHKRIAHVEKLLQKRLNVNKSKLERIEDMKQYVDEKSWLPSSFSMMLTRWRKESEQLQKKKDNTR